LRISYVELTLSNVGNSGNISISGDANVTAIGGFSSNNGGGAGIGTGGTGSSGSQGSLGTINISAIGIVVAGGGMGNNGRNGAAIGYGGENIGAGAETNTGISLTLRNITVTQTANGYVSPANARVSTDASPSFTVTANPGYEIGTVTVAPGTDPTVPANATTLNFSIPNVTVNTTVTATFVNVPDLVITPGSGWNLANNEFTITQNGDYEIGMRSGVTTTFQRIVAGSGITANITLNGVTIAGLSNSQSPIVLNPGADVTLTLQGVNTLTAGQDAAGIQTTGATLTIEGAGTLIARGGQDGAGIGGSNNGNGGTVIINGGTVEATGGRCGAGIGGGRRGDGENITINGGNVTAQGGAQGAAGIGGGDERSGGNVTINGGTVVATGTATTSGTADSGAGIGGVITINGGNITATAGNNNASAIGRGQNGTTESVTVNSDYWNYWTNTSNTDPGGLPTGSGVFTWSNTFRYIKLEDTRPPLTGTVNLFINPATGAVTASVSDGNTGTSGALTYTWSGGATGTGTTVTPALGTATTCTVTAADATGYISATVTVYRVIVTMSGNVGGDAASIINQYGKVGETKSIVYTIAQTGATSNSVAFTGGAVTDNGTGSAIYVIAAADATLGIVTITATFTHTSLPVKTVTVPAQSGTLTAGTAGTVTFAVTTTNIATGSAITLNNTNSIAGITLATGVSFK